MWNGDKLHLHMEVGLSRKGGICSLIPQMLLARYLLASGSSATVTEEPLLCLSWLPLPLAWSCPFLASKIKIILDQKAPSPAFSKTETRLGLTYLLASSVD